jgi:hypothetical protein
MKPFIYEFEEIIWRETVAFFIFPSTINKDQWIRTPEISLHIRIGERVINGKPEQTFEILTVALRENLRGNGWFRRYMFALGIAMHEAHIRIPNVVVIEYVINNRLSQHLRKYWHVMDNGLTFYITQNELLNYAALTKL